MAQSKYHSWLRRGAGITRRDWLRLSTAGAVGLAGSAWLESLAADVAGHPDRRRSCILLWMSGGPSQTDTFDLKPGHENGGPYKPIETSAPGIQLGEHLPKLAKHAQDMAIVRSMSTREGDHSRATYLMRTGRLPQGPVDYPALGAVVSKELQRPEQVLPGFVSIGSGFQFNPAAWSSGYLGPEFSPLMVGRGGAAELEVRNLRRPQGILPDQLASRLDLRQIIDAPYQADHPDLTVLSHQAAYNSAKRMVEGGAAEIFDLSREPAALRDAYGRNQFGQGCLLARRLVERGVPFVEVSLDGWDTHNDNFEQVKRLCETLDPAFSMLMADLKSRGLLETTLVVWMGEFGRTPQINGGTGRDHFPNAWSTVLAGGGIRGGQSIGRTSADGTTVDDRPVKVSDLLATVCLALGLDPMSQNMSNAGRPIRLADPDAEPLREALV